MQEGFGSPQIVEIYFCIFFLEVFVLTCASKSVSLLSSVVCVCVCVCESWPSFLCTWTLGCWHRLRKDCSFPMTLSWRPCPKAVDPTFQGLLPDSQFCSVRLHTCDFLPTPWCFRHCHFSASLGIRQNGFSNFALFPDGFVYSGFLKFPHGS